MNIHKVVQFICVLAAALHGSAAEMTTMVSPPYYMVPQHIPIAQHIAIQLDRDLLDACIGNYEFAPSSGGKVTIRREGDHLQMRLASGTKPMLDMYPMSETNFCHKIDDSLMTFVKDDILKLAPLIELCQV